MIVVVLSVLVIPFFVHALRSARLSEQDIACLVIWPGLTALVFLALTLSVPLPEGISLQYSGAAFLAITLGYARALLSMGLLVVIVQSMHEWPVGLWIDALLPVSMTVCIVTIARRYLPANPFVFLLGVSFIGIFLVYAVQATAGAFVRAYLPVSGIASGTVTSHNLMALFSEQIVWSLLLAAGEATLEGMVITLLVAYYPKAVAMFDEPFYLSRPM